MIPSPHVAGASLVEALQGVSVVIEQTVLSTTLVCSTQWYEFATNPSAVTFHDDHIEAQDWLIQHLLTGHY